jgi:hypothetical protein
MSTRTKFIPTTRVADENLTGFIPTTQVADVNLTKFMLATRVAGVIFFRHKYITSNINHKKHQQHDTNR